MQAPSHILRKAILEDDRRLVEELLKNNPRLAVQALATTDQYEPGIVHWIYAGDTALHLAAAAYRVEIAKALLAAGAEPSSANNRRASQPLHYACDGHLESPAWNPAQQVVMIRVLLRAKADIHAQDKTGATPLHRAVRTRCAAAVRSLLEAGSDTTLRNKSGPTPFHLAVQNTGRGGSGREAAKRAQREIIRTFVEKGVSVALKDRKGKTVLQWAKSDWVREMLANTAA